MPLMRRPSVALLLLAVAGLAAGCGKPVDLKQVLQVSDVSGGYHDAGLVEGRNKVVPSITFRPSSSQSWSTVSRKFAVCGPKSTEAP